MAPAPRRAPLGRRFALAKKAAEPAAQSDPQRVWPRPAPTAAPRVRDAHVRPRRARKRCVLTLFLHSSPLARTVSQSPISPMRQTIASRKHATSSRSCLLLASCIDSYWSATSRSALARAPSPPASCRRASVGSRPASPARRSRGSTLRRRVRTASRRRRGWPRLRLLRSGGQGRLHEQVSERF